FELVIRQQPEYGRMSGFANPKDVRLLAPPLIVQAKAHIEDRICYTLPEYHQSLICKVVLSENIDPVAVQQPSRPATIPIGYDSNLLGTGISNCHVLVDFEENRGGMYFIFPDLGVRAVGIYKLTCYLIHMDLTLDSFPVAATIETQPFQIYPPNEYPGKPAQTQLSKWFAQQGI
ncbi:velvet factor, partial [Gorgonomyces haynaldii]